MICKICNKEFKLKGMPYHLLKVHNITVQEYYDMYLKQDEGFCKTCGKPTKFISLSTGYAKHCNPRCAQLNPETRQKYKNTCLEKYGSENIFSSDHGKEQIKSACQRKYGVDYAFQANEVKQHIKETNLERYGVENPQQNSQIREQTNNTSINRYGNACPIHNSQIWKNIVNNMKASGNYSSLEDCLEQFFKDNNIEYKAQYKETRYPYHCDFYLPQTDTFIEINGFWMHNGHWFDVNNKEDLACLVRWKQKAKSKPQYAVAINTWTVRDLDKLNCAKKNNLNYIVLWNKSSLRDYIQNFTY